MTAYAVLPHALAEQVQRRVVHDLQKISLPSYMGGDLQWGSPASAKTHLAFKSITAEKHCFHMRNQWVTVATHNFLGRLVKLYITSYFVSEYCQLRNENPRVFYAAH